MKVTTWNINSVRLRLPLVERLLRDDAPDVLCLQEIKCVDDQFPRDALTRLGYEHQHVHGMKSYNGVAIVSRLPLTEPRVYHRCGREDRRHISAVVAGVELHNVYVPAGGDVPDTAVNDKFQHKLDFVDEMAAWGAGLSRAPRMLVGDLNIAPEEHDVWSHKQMQGVVSHTPVEVEKFCAARAASGWVDVGRHFVPSTEKLYSWWSYRNNDWRKSNRGRRLDHIWVSPDIVPRLQGITHAADARDWAIDAVGPSDHVPVTVEVRAKS